MKLPTAKMRRLFIATKHQLSNDHLKLLADLKHFMHNDEVVWVNASLQHITLRFLGATPEPLVQPVADMLAAIAREVPVFSLNMNKLGVFGSRYSPRVIWLGFEHFEAYQQLFDRIENQLLSMGFEANYGNTVPHLTLGRIKKIDNKKRFWSWITEYKTIEPQKVIFDELMLFQSFLTPQGPIYKPLKKIKLKP
ncbi:MAG: RNA 2',3'-cyclic phosphodiesterase [Bacteroidales bacterium]|jgi:2'-5' RNA ligase|nr:RNA 2',3'-cyclic phosphodiesterase [Bacteroidales bacterium]